MEKNVGGYSLFSDVIEYAVQQLERVSQPARRKIFLPGPQKMTNQTGRTG